MKTRGHKLVYQCACLAVFALGLTAMVESAASAPQNQLTSNLPTAVLDVPAEIGVGTNLVLDGKRSWDVNGQVVRWEWRHVDGPVSSQLIGLPRDTNVSNYTVPADPARGMRPGVHRFQLIVTDDAGNASAPVVANVTVVDDLAPTAVLDVPAEIGVGTNLVLDGKRSWDLNGQVVRWEWRHVSGSGGMDLNLPIATNVSNYTVPADPARGMRPGVHRFQLIVTDDAGNASTSVVANVTVGKPMLDTLERNPSAALSQPPNQPASDLLTPAPTLAIPADLIAPAAPASRENCGTVLTGSIDDPDSAVNPCPTGCERGERLWVKTYESGDRTQYEASYQCYMPAVPTLSMPADAPSSGENCGTYWTGWMETLDAAVNPCPKGCLRGQKPSVKTGLSGHGIKYDVNYQCYMPETPTLSMPADAPSSGENCGTYWTGWMETLDTEVNPCPQNCVRGQKPTVKTGLSDHGIKYDVNYQCYTATTTMAPGARAPKPITDASTAPQSVSSTPSGKLIPASGPWGAFVRVEGARFGSAETVRGMWFPIDGATQPPSMSQTVTLRGRDGADAIEIQIPTDPLSSGWSGDFTNGSLRLLLTMPDESIIYAGQYTIDTGGVRDNLRKQFGIPGKSQPAAQNGAAQSSEVTAQAIGAGSAPQPGPQLTDTFSRPPIQEVMNPPGASGSAATLPPTIRGQGGDVASRPIDTSALSQHGPRSFDLAGFAASGTSLAIPPHSFELTGFTASGTSLAIPPHSFELAGFTASGTMITIPPHSFELLGFTASGTAIAIPPHSFELAGFTASGTAITTPRRSFELVGFTASGTSLEIPPHSFDLTGWTGIGAMNKPTRRIR